MYNEEIKKRYIEDKTAIATVDKFFLPNLFKKSESFEDELGKDLCNFTTSEIENMYKTLDYKSFDSIVVNNSMYSMYVNWCLNQGMIVDSQNHFLEFDKRRLASLVNKMMQNIQIVTRETVLKWCLEFPNPSDCFLVLGAFEGVKGKNYCDFVNLKMQDINLKDNTIKLYSRDKPLIFSKQLCNYGIESAMESEYRSVSGEMKHNVEFIPSDKVIKDYPNCIDNTTEYQMGKRIYNKITRALNYVGVGDYMTVSSLVNSGIIYTIKSKSKRLNISCEEYLSTHLNEISCQYGKRLVKSNLLIKYEEYLD